MKKKVLLIGPDTRFLGGVANYYKNVLPALNNSQNYEIFYVQIGSENNPKLKLLLPFIDLFKVILAMLMKNPSIVHINPSLNIKAIIRDAIFVLMARLFRKKVVIFFRGWNKKNQHYFSDKPLMYLSRYLLKADRYIVLNNLVKDFLKANDVNEKNIFYGSTVIPEEFTTTISLKSIKNLSNDRLKLLFLGRIEKEKGLFELIDAIKMIKDNVLLTIVGNGSAWDALNNMITGDPKLSSSVELHTSKVREEKLQMYMEHDVFILPSYSEGMPNSLLEALSQGLIIVGSNVGAIPDLITEYSGVLIEPQSKEEVTNGIDNVLNNYQELFQKANDCSSSVQKNFSPEMAAKFIEKVYQTLHEK